MNDDESRVAQPFTGSQFQFGSVDNFHAANWQIHHYSGAYCNQVAAGRQRQPIASLPRQGSQSKHCVNDRAMLALFPLTATALALTI